MTQTGVTPPTFVLFCNDSELFHSSYQRYIENCLREAFDFSGTPIRFVIKQKGENPKGVEIK
jgi:GTP-binding protein